jgi:four helix bundle protein
MRDAYRLRVTKAAEDLAVLTYLVTKNFPREERFGLIAQMRKAAVSVGSNICEGCGHESERAFLVFLHHALGSTGELEFQSRLSRRLRFGVDSEVSALVDESGAMKRQLSTLITTVRNRL